MKDQSTEIVKCKLCIVGAGHAGLNALFVASQYLKKNDKVLLVDRISQSGGMWNDTYDYVRLHQPYQLFTVGNLKWKLKKPRHYLADVGEIKSHLNDCLENCKKQISLEEYYGFSLEKIIEADAENESCVQLHCRNTKNDRTIIVDAERAILAFGHNVPTLEPINFLSKSVVSTSPNLVDSDIDTTSSKPIYIIGGGKTAMDTATYVLEKYPNREVNLIVGGGTIFFNRTKYFPLGLRRWFSPKLFVEIFSDFAKKFDGTNGKTAFKYFRDKYCLSLSDKDHHFMYALISEDEISNIKHRVNELIHNYLVDVVDGPEGAQITFRDGKVKLVEDGSVFINCTGHLLSGEHDYKAFQINNEKILNINPRALIHILSGVSTYFLVHLFMLNKLKSTPIIALDAVETRKNNKTEWGAISATLTLHNMLVIMDVVPFKVLKNFGMDLDLWFPLPRRIFSLILLKLKSRKLLLHCKNSLKTAAQHYNFSINKIGSGND